MDKRRGKNPGSLGVPPLSWVLHATKVGECPLEVLALRRAELDFVQRLVKDVESGELTGIEEWRSWYAPDGERADIDTDQPTT